MADVETGSLIPIVSLGGIKSQPGMGRVITSFAFPPTIAIVNYVLSPNPKRISAIFINKGDPANVGEIMYLYIGENGAPIKLLEYGSFQIDSNFPWTGSVSVIYTGTNSPYLVGYEVSVA